MGRTAVGGGAPVVTPCFFGSCCRGLGFLLFAAILFLLLGPASARCESAAVFVSATVLSKNNCKFSNPSSLTLNFGVLDPGVPIPPDSTARASIDFVCRGSAQLAAFGFTDDDGLYETGPNANRMRHSSVPTEYLPYTLSLDPASGIVPKNVPRTVTVSGTVRGADYQNAYAGSYSDSVVITLLP